MISINATLFLQIIHFLILAFILNRLMFRPIIKLMDERKKYLGETKNEVARVEKETDDLMKKCIAIEKNAKDNARNRNTELRQEIMMEAEKIINDTRSQASTIKDKTAEEINDQLRIASQAIRGEAMVLADDITEMVIGRRIGN
ncbi:MAG: ATP synthase F0 subunit B [Deltaproteobacteria bacterium]|nr:ATP synthase F0 subunit B [Deltaproteobacteria bacterium]